ncbi:MAG TPA: BON domain-containing protein [Dyella sp.]|uniref:BON domain-containing protein n=1 Tax=Dyella sp. TaxID=1869338 RepID=UPI002F9355F7
MPTDSDLARWLQTIRERLDVASASRGRDIDIVVDHGVVLLTGTVDNQQCKDDIEAIVRASVHGLITGVENRLTVEHAQTELP